MSTTPTIPPTPKEKGVAPDEAASVIDTSKMNEGQRAALELTEAARETQERRSIAGGLFMGAFDLRGVFPFPEQNPHDREQGEAFLERLEKFLREKVDP